MKKIFFAFFILCNSIVATGQTTIIMQKENGVYKVPCVVNGLKLKFIFDTGASDVSISSTEALFMLKNDYMQVEDVLDKQYYKDANGDISVGTKIIIRKIEFAGLTLQDVEASVVNNLDAPLLLGLSAISKLGKIQMDLDNNSLTILNSTSIQNNPITVFKSNLNQNEILIKVGNENYGVNDFLNVYKKNSEGKEVDYSEKAVQDYLNLYINMRLKVKESREMHLDSEQSIFNEMATYHSLLAKSYLIDKVVTNQLVEEAYNRLGKEIHVTHILVKCDQNALPADTLRAYKQINNLYSLLKNGKDFNQLAKDSSDDPSAKDNKGDLGYITAMQVVYPFENAAYNTAVGQYSKPFRTRFGYHILKVIDVRPAHGTIEVEHIFVKVTKDFTHDDSLKAKTKIDQIYQTLTEGESFEDLAKNESEDKTSSGDGGKLPKFGTGKMTSDFENAAFALKNIGDFSRPAMTKYGWHIIKLISSTPIPSLDAYRETLRKQVEKDSRIDIAKTSYIYKTKTKFNFLENKVAINELMSKMDSNLIKGIWKADQLTGLNKTVFTLTDKTLIPETKNFTQQDLAEFIDKNQRKYLQPNEKIIMFNNLYNAFVENSLFTFQENRLDLEDPDFSAIMNEYSDGILLFNITDQKVWSKATKDEVGLTAYWKENKYKYDSKPLAEVRGYVVADYQEYLEMEWIKNLRIKYPVTINAQLLNSIIKK